MTRDEQRTRLLNDYLNALNRIRESKTEEEIKYYLGKTLAYNEVMMNLSLIEVDHFANNCSDTSSIYIKRFEQIIGGRK